MILYADVRAALVKATGARPGAYADLHEIQTALRQMGFEDPHLLDVATELGAMSDMGEATTVGFGLNRTARYDGAVVVMPDGAAYPLITTDDRRAVVTNDPIVFGTMLGRIYPDVRPGPITDEGSSTE